MPCKNKDQSSVPRAPVKVLNMVVYTCTPNAGEMEISRPGAYSQCSLFGGIQANDSEVSRIPERHSALSYGLHRHILTFPPPNTHEGIQMHMRFKTTATGAWRVESVVKATGILAEDPLASVPDNHLSIPGNPVCSSGLQGHQEPTWYVYTYEGKCSHT